MRVLVLLALALPPAALGQEKGVPPRLLALRGAKVYPGSGPALEHSTILVENGRISAVGREIPVPPEATVVDASGKVIIPGLIDAASRLFLEPGDRGPGSAEQTSLDAIDRTSELYLEALEQGVTAVYVGPPSTGPVNGLGAVLRLDRARTVLAKDAALKLSVGVAPGDTSTAALRYESFLQIRQAFDQAKQYGEAWTKYRKEQAEYDQKKSAPADVPAGKPQKPKSDPRQEVLLRALDPKDRLPVRLEAHTSDAILLAIRLAQDYKLRAVLEGATEAWRVADAVKQSGLPVVAGPVIPTGASSVDLIHHSTGCAGALVRAGVPVAIGSFGDEPGGATRFLADSAALASSRGLSREQALAAITIEAAKALGIAAGHGSIEKGKAADLVVLSGEPFDRQTFVERTFVDGQAVFLRKGE
jgi:imidazolonepropionase-like amidohydrolase